MPGGCQGERLGIMSHQPIAAQTHWVLEPLKKAHVHAVLSLKSVLLLSTVQMQYVTIVLCTAHQKLSAPAVMPEHCCPEDRTHTGDWQQMELRYIADVTVTDRCDKLA